MSGENRSEVLIVRITPSLKKKLEEKAEETRRSLSSLAFLILDTEVKERTS